MIHEIGRELVTYLRAQGCPVDVVDGPEKRGSANYRERVVIEHDEGGDRFGPTRSQRINPSQRFVRNIGVKVTLYAKSPSANALEFEHKRRCEHLLDLVLVGLDEVCRDRRNGWTISGGRFVAPSDLEESERQPGARYELTLTVERAVFAQKWNGDIRPEATLTAIHSTTRVDEDEYACGASPGAASAALASVVVSPLAFAP